MKNTYKSLNIISLLALLIFSFIACEEDFTTLESDIDINDNFSTDVVKYAVKAYTKKINRVQTNNLPLALLGVYNDELYGKTTANFIAQMSPNPASFSPNFGDNVVLDSVILTVPYFSSTIEINSDGGTTYKLDSVYGDSPFKLSILRNNYFLRSLSVLNEEGLNENLIFFSDGMTSEGTQINPITDVEGDLLYEDNNFIPDASQIILKDIDDNITSRLAPALRIRLDDPVTNIWQLPDYWKTRILDLEGGTELSNQNNFIDYFRGLYFKAESINDEGNMLAFNFTTNASLTIYYTSDATDVETGEDSQEQGVFSINFSENSLNFFDNNFTIDDGNSVDGDETLFLKGGEGSFAIIELFDLLEFDDNPNTDNTFEAFKKDFVEVKDELSGNFKKSKKLINEAYLKIFVNQTQSLDNEPKRLYIYDVKNNIPLIDYLLDQTTDKRIHLEPLNKEIGLGSYKIRITEYINNILLRDSTNLQLGLVVSNNVILEGASNNFFQVETSNTNLDEVDIIPLSSIIEPRGTILYGSNPNVPETSRIQLEIYYTEPDSN